MTENEHSSFMKTNPWEAMQDWNRQREMAIERLGDARPGGREARRQNLGGAGSAAAGEAGWLAPPERPPGPRDIGLAEAWAKFQATRPGDFCRGTFRQYVRDTLGRHLCGNLAYWLECQLKLGALVVVVERRFGGGQAGRTFRFKNEGNPVPVTQKIPATMERRMREYAATQSEFTAHDLCAALGFQSYGTAKNYISYGCRDGWLVKTVIKAGNGNPQKYRLKKVPGAARPGRACST